MAHYYSSFFFIPTFSGRFCSGYLLLALLLLSSLSRGQCFKPAIEVSAKHDNIVVGDFNGDSRPDFATTQYNNDSITVFLNRGGGRFNTGSRFFVDRYADSLAVGDLNTDGKPDIAAVSDSANYDLVSILFGDGRGNFAAPVNLKVGNYTAISVLISDFNTDGYPDLVTTSLYDSITVFLNDGQARFTRGVKYNAGKSTQISRTRAGDFNGDGKPDLILLQDNHNDYFVSLLLNNGAGGFGAATIIRDKAFKDAKSAEISDFNGDGKPDLVVVSDSITILLNTGTGGFTVSKTMNPNRGPYRCCYVVAGDFNNDGKADLALPGYVLLGKGDGLFNTPFSFSFTPINSYGSFLTGDFDSDGQTDILAGQVSILLNCTRPLNTAPKPTPNSNQTATVGMPFAHTVNAFTDAETPNSLTYSASLTPANGLSFDPTTRLISGTPSLSGITAVTIMATDPAGVSDATSFTITAKPPIVLGLDKPETGLLTLSPNPTTDLVQVVLNNAYRGVVSVRLMSAGGQLVGMYTSIKTGETWQHTLSVQGLPAGSYYLGLHQNGQRSVGKLLKL